MRHKHHALADRYVGCACRLYTPDGIQHAIVAGRHNTFATIAALKGALSIQVNWLTVERKMEGDKTFYAC